MKTKFMRLVFWQNLLSFYQVPHITALAAHPGVEVTWVVQETITPDRIAQGWKVPDVNGVTVVVAPDDAAVGRLVSERVEDSVHIFTGIHQDPIARKAFYQSIKTSAQVGLLVEPPFPGRVRDLISPPLHWSHRLMYGKHIRFIMAMGHLSVNFYKSVGYPNSMVFPYGYFPPAPPDAATLSAAAVPPDSTQTQTVPLFYLGQMIERKGVDLLLQALASLTDLNWHLTLVGSGDQKDALVALGRQLGLESHLTFYNSLENQAAMQIMAQSDLFILPSRHDGWGVVINEALMRGVPVICSDRCGAADLLGEPWRGETFSAGSTSSLASVLRRWIEHGRRTPEEAERIRAWSRCIDGDVAAEYLLAALRCALFGEPRPLPPWQNSAFLAPERHSVLNAVR